MQQAGNAVTDESKKSMQEWGRALLAPVVVALIVGVTASYLTAQQAIAVQAERLESQEQEIESLQDSSEMVIRLEERLVNHGDALERIEDKIDAENSRVDR